MPRYSLGLDFGTESVRAILVDLADGRVAASAEREYPHGVISDALPAGGAPLQRDWFLQDPDDYLYCLKQVVGESLEGGGTGADEVLGIGLDFTSCTLLPCDADGAPLCRDPELRSEPQAWVKLWKHHGAAAEAQQVAEAARRRGERFLDYYAGAISSEWLMPKVLETIHRAPQVYERAFTFVEAADWVVWQLTGALARSACCAGYKGQYVRELGWPSEGFLREVEPRMAGLFTEKMPGPVLAPGTRVGGLTGEWARRLGLAEGTPVAAPFIDAHAAVPGCGVTEPRTMALALGTSFCQMLLAREAVFFEGVAGIVQDGIVPGFYGYESGQTAGGDIYAWFVENCVPSEYKAEAERRGISAHELLTERAERLAPAQSGLLALDWWNGNRSILMDAELSGLLLGLTLDTRPEEIYRACIEGTMFGTRRIVQAYADAGLPVDRFVASGGIPRRNPFAMQLLADILNRPIEVAGAEQPAAFGSALLGATVASGRGGYGSIREAARALAPPPSGVYEPDPQAAKVYDRLYAEYVTLYDYFGRAEQVMRRLRDLRG
ncbi:MAG: ribulokinase [Planctomycetes bacterium]|nr:ribulokinase [Planctomycetota bacterium]